jgi:hypothetical protein
MLWEVEELQKISELQPELVEDALKNLWKNKPELHRAVVVNAKHLRVRSFNLTFSLLFAKFPL